MVEPVPFVIESPRHNRRWSCAVTVLSWISLDVGKVMHEYESILVITTMNIRIDTIILNYEKPE